MYKNINQTLAAVCELSDFNRIITEQFADIVNDMSGSH